MGSGDISEWKTRKLFIDKLLAVAKWLPIVGYQENKTYDKASVEEYPTSSGPADYVLFNNKRPLAAVEGKKLAVGPQNVLQQAQRYARTITNTPFSFGEFKLPFIYSTNGVVVWFQDLRHPLNRSREVAAIHTPDALEGLLAKNEDACIKWLLDHPVDNDYLRPYQKEAIC